ncbi:MAG: tRNA (N6-isopentenyl adenosine(37)-C2)-methylthiotransferase MiaB [Deltaproteobacteria bacterium]|nr:tRNA (N6-isopentenyl adenosine(37)-C2)-methylthiotransferase MiaB [Deltaproteobacteria bacterium]
MSQEISGTYYIETYGCQMNEHDSEKMALLLEELGLAPAQSPDHARVVIVNTCSIREKAEHKVYSALGKLKSLKRRNPEMITVVAGCVAQQEKQKLLKRIDHLDLVLGTHSIAELPRALERVAQTRERSALTEFSQNTESLHLPAPNKGKSPVCSYVTIMQGCSNFCTYCVVPYTRGPEQSRPAHEILEEVRGLAGTGVREITLLGQNVNAYGNDLPDGMSFAQLLEQLDKVEPLDRIRFTTSHPRDFNDDLIAAIRDLERVCEHVHLPLQSGSDRVLSAMRRGYSLAQYIEKTDRLREEVSGVAITADMIVGFPGETEADFNATVEALTKIRFDQIFSFKYSPRPGTAALRLPDHLTEDVKSLRLSRIHEVQDQITEEYHKAAEGTEEEVLIEGVRQRDNQGFGRTRTNKIVNLNRPDGIGPGDLVKVRITRGLKHSLIGEVI